MPTAGEVIRQECKKFDIELSPSDVEYVLWEKTGYPCFWPDPEKTPEENLRIQVREWAKEQKGKPKKSNTTKKLKAVKKGKKG